MAPIPKWCAARRLVVDAFEGSGRRVRSIFAAQPSSDKRHLAIPELVTGIGQDAKRKIDTQETPRILKQLTTANLEIASWILTECERISDKAQLRRLGVL